MLVVNLKRSRDAPFERPMLVRSLHASSISLRRFDSAFGAGSVATTSNPRARYRAAQLAPMAPVPTITIRRTGLSKDIGFFLLLARNLRCHEAVANFPFLGPSVAGTSHC